MLFFTDLDKTIVYSGYREHYCVEYKEKQEITYMTNEGKRQLDNLFKKEGFRMIPCTLRSFEQTKRIEFITDELTPVVICDNGFSIYNKGVLDKSWDKKMQSYIVKYPMSETYKEIDDLITTANIPISQIKSNRDAFFTVIFKNIADAEYFSDKIISKVDLSLYKIEKQGRKLYIIPVFLDKVLALRYIKSLFPNEMVVTAGDSDVDVAFVKEGKIAIIPGHSKLKINKAITTKSKGIDSGKEIFDIINRIVQKQI
jgi:hypothetical protein